MTLAATTTRVLTRGQLRDCVDLPVLAEELRQALTGYDEDAGVAHRLRSRPHPSVTAMVLAPGLAPGVPAYTVKVHAKNPDRRPAITGVICLHDLTTGDLLAVMDSEWLIAVRTGVGAGLGTHVLARPGSGDVGVVGAGVQGRASLRALSSLRRLSSVHVHDVVPEAAAAFAEEVEGELGVPVQVRSSAAEVAGACDVLLVATWGREPVLDADTVRPGTHVTSLGADEPGKVELAPSLLDLALVVTDDRRLASTVLSRVDTTVGAILRGEHPGRQTDEQVTAYSPVGLPLQDCVIAWRAHRRAAARGVGLAVDLGQ